MCVYLGEHPLGPGASGPGVHGADVSAGRHSAAAVARGDHAAGEGAGEINIRSLTKKQRDYGKQILCFISRIYGIILPNRLSYFSRWLKPPTRVC